MRQVSFPPQAYLIGAQKAGTTSLAFLLQQHPKISLSDPKETHFFSVKFDLGLEWYRSNFSFNDGQTLLDASTSYAMANFDGSTNFGIKANVAGRICSLRPDAKFIYILRDPVERAISAYWHNVRFHSERRSFREAIIDNPPYVWIGQYYKQLQRYLDHFNRSRFLLLDFRELEADPGAIAIKVVRFLGLSEAGVSFDLAEPKNRGFQLTVLGRLVARTFGNDAAFFRASRLVRKAMPASHLYRLGRRMLITDLKMISSADREWLREMFRGDEEELGKWSGISFHHES